MQRIIRLLPELPYEPSWRAMQSYAKRRTDADPDEIWLLEHPPVFTQGLAGKAEHLLSPAPIPVVQIDRGGQVTYHGPGQIVCYVLLNLRRNKLTVKPLVKLIEQCVIDLLDEYEIPASRRENAPGIYVDGAKIASLGLRIKGGNTYHGLALNVDMDLRPFKKINPCGYADMPITQCRDLGISASRDMLRKALAKQLASHLHYAPDSLIWTTDYPDDL